MAVLPPAAYTVITKNYLAHARHTFDGLADQHPDWPQFVFLADRVDGWFDPGAERFTVVECEDLGLSDLEERMSRYTMFEFLSSLQPVCARWLAEHGHRSVVRLDVDLMFLNPMPQLPAMLTGETSVLLTPHILEPLKREWRFERLLLRYGSFNWGFGGINVASQEGGRFLEWWEARAAVDCRDNPGKGFYLNQKWMDLVPALFPNAVVIRDPGFNVAAWNLAERRVERVDGRWTVNGVPLCFFHFSRSQPAERLFSSTYRHASPEVAPLFDLFLARLEERGYEEVRMWPNAFEGRLQRSQPEGQPMRSRLKASAIRRLRRLTRRG
jgi:hypothetical protein